MRRAPGVELAGYLGSAVGVGEAARRYVAALRSAGVPVLERDVALPGRDAVRAPVPPGPIATPEAVACNVLCLNPEQLAPYLQSPHSPARVGRTTVGIWSWEVDVLPPGWPAAAAELDEVWTYSRFAADLIGAALGKSVWGAAPPLPPRETLAPLPFGLPGGFKVLVMFDYLSTLERKNPLGAITAFRRAFEPNAGASLIVKSVNARHRPEQAAEVARAAGGREDIVLVDRTLAAGERDALVAACDCYLSLHRSEGHGLPLAEAMACGKPVVATAYGGNLEFMTTANSYLVACKPVRVGGQVEHYPTDATWAEPDLAHATQLLRAVHEQPREAASRGARAREDVNRLLAPEAVGARMRERIERVCDRRGELRRRLRRLIPGWVSLPA